MKAEPEIKIYFEQGSLSIESKNFDVCKVCAEAVYDKRTLRYRLAPYLYRTLVEGFIDRRIPYEDYARGYEKIPLPLKTKITPREHQANALKKWEEMRYKGVVSLPTGAGKTILAILCMAKTQRSTLIVVPTIDLLHQWKSVLSKFFDQDIGGLGGGEKNILGITVATYDSAKIYIEYFGSKFGLIVFDECHHLPAPYYQSIAYSAIAPYRLGLSATVERSDGGEDIIYKLLGDKIYSNEISEMSMDGVLAPYDIKQIEVDLTKEERENYELNRSIYLNFVKQNGINFSQPDGWKQFIIRASRSEQGKLAFSAYREQKKLAQAAEGKLEKIWHIINEHINESTIIFTDDNAFAYHIGQTFILPVLTHKTKSVERKKMLEEFRGGRIKVLVTSKVLNEGVDVPEARIGIVASGSGAVREHVQRLGRILRHVPGKRAVLYEIISKSTNEQNVNFRRRQHNAYQRPY